MPTLAHLLHLSPETLWMVAKVLIVFGGPFTLASLLTWVERRGAAMIQDRIGPNRAALFGKWRLLGLPQIAADGIKAFLKEDLVPPHVNKLVFWVAPLLTFLPAVMGFAIIPFGQSFVSGGQTYHLSLLDPGNGMGMLYPLAIGSMAVYGVLTAAWSSNNKWSILGGMRASAQMVSYEIGMSLAVITVFMRAGAYDPHQIIQAQWGLWNVLPQFLGFLVFTTCMFAETNRLPFDFAEGEAEIVAGYLTEYGSMKFALMYLSEYVHMVTASALIVTLYFGGWRVPFVADPGVWLSVLAFVIKLLFFCWLFIWIRWTLPRFRYDQLMKLGWKVMLPLSMANFLIHAFLMFKGGLTMAILIKQVELSWLDRTYVWPILKGMAITLGHFFRQLFTPTAKRFTIQYPEMKKEMPEGYRGLHELKRFEDGSVKCVACFMCAEACPARCITIEAEEFSELNLTQGFEEKRPKRFEIDLLRCIFCGMCEEACPKDAIWLRKDYELVGVDREGLRYGKWDLLNTYAGLDGKPVLTTDPKPSTPSRKEVACS